MSEIWISGIGNVSEYMPEIRRLAKGKMIQSVNTPGVRTKINYVLYEDFYRSLPVKTGAFQDSPINENPSIRYQYDKHGLPRKPYRYAYGKIDDEGITFDPFEVSKGVEHHYASYIKMGGAFLGSRIRNSTARKRRAIAKILIEEANDAND